MTIAVDCDIKPQTKQNKQTDLQWMGLHKHHNIYCIVWPFYKNACTYNIAFVSIINNNGLIHFSEGDGKRLEAELNQKGPGEAYYVYCDVTKEEDIKVTCIEYNFISEGSLVVRQFRLNRLKCMLSPYLTGLRLFCDNLLWQRFGTSKCI